MEKLVLALVNASRHLRRYFQEHPIHVLTDYRINTVLSKPELYGSLGKWAIELGAHTIIYKPRPAIKGQVLADFFAEIPAEKIEECQNEQVPKPIPDSKVTWSLFTDGASNEQGAAAGLRLVSHDNTEFTYVIRLEFPSTNNEAEYEAFLAGLRLADKMGARHLNTHVDSILIAGHINGIYDAKDPVMAKYVEQAKLLIKRFTTCTVVHINRSGNKEADALSKMASTAWPHMAKEVRIKTLAQPSVLTRLVNVTQTGAGSWMTPIQSYLATCTLLTQKAEARKIQYKSEHYQPMMVFCTNAPTWALS